MHEATLAAAGSSDWWAPPIPTAASTVTGWRWWQLTDSGHLTGFHVPQARIPWPRAGIRAGCNQGTHDSFDCPARDCECGLRIMPDLAHLLDGLVNEPARTGITPAVFARIGGRGYLTDRERHGVEHVPDVIGQVVGWGRTEDACQWDDPPGTVRAQYAKAGPVLYLSRHVARYTKLVKRRYKVTVRLGSARGLGWLDEIAAAEGVDAAESIE